MSRDTARFMVVPFTGGVWKILDLHLCRYTRMYDTESAAKRYAAGRNRKYPRKYVRCEACDSAPCCCEAGGRLDTVQRMTGGEA